MTERTISLLVTLDKEYRTDDAEAILNAIKMIKGILEVNVNIFSCADQMNAFSVKRQLKSDFFQKLYRAFEE